MALILPPKETMEIEFKSDVKKLSDNDLVDAVVAFANTIGGSINMDNCLLFLQPFIWELKMMEQLPDCMNNIEILRSLRL